MQDLQSVRLSSFREAMDKRDVRAMRSLLEDGLGKLPQKLADAALLVAASGNALATVELLLRAGANPNTRDGAGKTPAYCAADLNNPEMLKALLAAGADPNGAPVPGAQPIRCAVEAGHLPLVEMLTTARAKVDFADEFGGTLLHRAVELGHYEVVRHLLSAGLPINVRDRGGNTPLHEAAGKRTRMVYALIQRGADVNATAEDGRTPALEAALAGSIEAFQLLVDSGADPLARDERGLSAFDLALSGERQAMAVYALQYYPDLIPAGEALDQAFVLAVRRGCTPVAKMLVNLGADIGQKPGGRTLLQIAPSRDADELKRYLRSLKTGIKIAEAMGEPEGPASTCGMPAL